MTEEYKKCLEDPIYFIEKHCLINNKPIKLKDYQKAFIKYVSRSKKFYEQKIKELCKFFKARAYINLTPKSIKKTAMLQLKYLTQRIYEGDFKKIWKSWNTCAGEIKGEKSRWVVDIDKQLSEEEYNKFLKYLTYLEPIGNKLIAIIPTKSGVHLITTPFNIKQFKEQCPGIDVHKNNPTLLYCL